MFGHKKSLGVTRSIPTLNPDYYIEIHRAITANGGTDTVTEVAAGVANAMYNTGMTYFEKLGDRRARRSFETRFETRARGDVTVADSVIDFLLAYDPSTEEFIRTLLGRLREVLGKPA